MSHNKIIPLSIFIFFALVGCGGGDSTSNSGYSSIPDHSNYSSFTISTPSSIPEPNITGVFFLTTKDGTFTQSGNIYTITKGGTYSLVGNLNGQILISAGDNDIIELSLEGATITYGNDSPIKALNADEVAVKAKSGTLNLVKETRAIKNVEDNNLGEGAINSAVDLTFKGSGTLVVVGTYNNGIHSSNDLDIQNLTLQVTAPNNAIKGNDSVTIESGTIYAYSRYGEGIKTKQSDISSKGKQRGTIEIDGGYVYVDSLYNGMAASFNIIVNQLDDAIPTELNVKNGKISSFYVPASFDEDVPAVGLIALNEIIINKGKVAIISDDAAINSVYGETLDNGNLGLGNITISGGNISVSSNEDGVRADNTLTITNGSLASISATEGIEANHIEISGGNIHIFGSDDGINASKKIDEFPSMIVSGGFINVTVASGDTDGIDSNGSFQQTGGVIISRGSSGEGSPISTALESDGNCSITGGTFIAFNGIETTPTVNSSISKASTGSGPSSHSFLSGEYNLSGTNVNINFINEYQYSSFIIYSSSLEENAEYVLQMNDNNVLSWNQSSKNVTIG